MKHVHTLFLVVVAATLSVMAGLSNADMSAAVNASPSVSIVRLSNVRGETWPGDFNGDGLTDLVILRPGPHKPHTASTATAEFVDPTVSG